MVVRGTPSSNTRCDASVSTREAPATVHRLKMEPVLSRNGGTGWKIDERSQHHGSTHEEKLFYVRRCRPLDDRSDRHSHSARAQGSRAWRQFLHSALILIITNGIQLFSDENPRLGQHCRCPSRSGYRDIQFTFVDFHVGTSRMYLLGFLLICNSVCVLLIEFF